VGEEIDLAFPHGDDAEILECGVEAALDADLARHDIGVGVVVELDRHLGRGARDDPDDLHSLDGVAVEAVT
jgi:hypothetical protein